MHTPALSSAGGLAERVGAALPWRPCGRALGAGAVALCAVMLVAINHAPAVSALAAALLVLLASVAAVLSGAPVGKRSAYVGQGLLIGLALLGGAGLVYLLGAVWGALIFTVAMMLALSSLGTRGGEWPREYIWPRYVARGALFGLVFLGGVVLAYGLHAVWWTFMH